MKRMIIRPSDIHYSQDSINKYFDRYSAHCSQTVGQTLDEVLVDKSKLSDIPSISVVRLPGYKDRWFSVDNRRLWVFKELHRIGLLNQIEVICTAFDQYQHGRKITTKNGGISIRIRGDGKPGGYGHTFPSNCYQKLMEVYPKHENRKHENKRHQNEIPIESRQKPLSAVQTNAAKFHSTKTTFTEEKFTKSYIPEESDRSRSSYHSQRNQSSLWDPLNKYSAQCVGAVSSASPNTRGSHDTPSNITTLRSEQHNFQLETESQFRPFGYNEYKSNMKPLRHSETFENVSYENKAGTESGEDLMISRNFRDLRVSEPSRVYSGNAGKCEKSVHSSKDNEKENSVTNPHIYNNATKSVATGLKSTTQGGDSMPKHLKSHRTSQESEIVRKGLPTTCMYKMYVTDKNETNAIESNNYRSLHKGIHVLKSSRQTTGEGKVPGDLHNVLKRKQDAAATYAHAKAISDALEVKETHLKKTVRNMSRDSVPHVSESHFRTPIAHGAAAVTTGTTDRAFYHRPMSPEPIVVKAEPSIPVNRTCQHSKQLSVHRYKYVTVEEVKINMRKLLYRQIYKDLIQNWSTECLYGSSDA